MINELRTKIYQQLVLAIKTFYMQAPYGETLPYCVFTILSVPRDYDTATNIDTVNLQVSLFTNTAGSLFSYQDNITNVLEIDKSNYNTTQANCIKIDREFIRYDYGDNIFSCHIAYKLILSN